jgi:hypothetical protein
MAVTLIKPQMGMKVKLEKYRDYTTGYIITTNDNLTSPLEVAVALAASGIKKGNYASWDPPAICKSIDISQEEKRKWIATANWSTEPGEWKDEDGKPVASPFASWPIIEAAAKPFQIYPEKDIADKVIQNTAKDPFDPPVPFDVVHPLIKITANYASFELSHLETWMFCTNSATFGGYAEDRVLLVDIDPKRMTYDDPDNNTIVYWQITYTFEALSRGETDDWFPTKIANRGKKQLVSGVKKKITVTNDNGVISEVTSDCWLNENGTVNLDGASPPWYEIFAMNYRADFNDLFSDWW